MIIGIAGKAGSGKTTAARFLEEELGYERIPFAAPLKAMARAFGLSPAQLTTEKEVSCDLLCGKTPRQFMQMLGTEFGRDMIGKDLWIRAWKRAVGDEAMVTFGPLYVVADDVRFPEEAATIRAMGGKVIRIEREGAGSASGGAHASESGDGIVADVVIRNDGDLETLFRKVAEVAYSNEIGGS